MRILDAMKLSSAVVTAVMFLSSCATDPDHIQAYYTSPYKYREYDCKQLSGELRYTGHKIEELRDRLQQRRHRDEVQAAFSWFYCVTCPFLNGDGPEAEEFARTKGEFEALRTEAYRKDCGIEGLSPKEIIDRSEDALWRHKQDGN